MIDSEIREQAYQFFLEEAPELLQIIETNLLKLSEGVHTPRQERSFAQIHDLMRSAHSIKGGAATVGLEAIATIAHRIESIFKALYSDRVVIDTELESLLLQAYDCLRATVEQEIAGNCDSELVAAAEPTLSELESRLGDALQEMDNYIPSSDDIGIDLVASILEGDFLQVIEQLDLVVNNPDQYDLGAELCTQAEILIGFAELLDLPSLEEIAQTALTASELHPERVAEIIALTVADLQTVKAAVQKKEPISPSEALIALAHKIEGTPQTLDEACLGFANSEPIEDSTIIASIIEEPETITPTLEDVFADAQLDELASLEMLLEAETDASDLAVSLVPIDRSLVLSNSDEEKAELKRDRIGLAREPEKVLSHSTSVQERQGQKNNYTHRSKVNSLGNIKAKVDLDRLERMNNFVGELVINRNSFALQHEQLQAISQKLQQRLEQFRRLTAPIQQLSDQILIKSLHIQSNQLDSASPTADFDTLEMDRYGDIHSLIQGVVEEMTQFEEAVEDITLVTRQSALTLKQQQKTLTNLRDELMWARMLPLGEVVNHFPRSLRDLSIKYQKPVNLNLSGTEILIDKGILEKLHDPLLHLLRNAFDHGIESPEIRRRQGKPEVGQIEIRAYHRGDRTLIEIKDDGAGLNLDKITKKAIEKGWLSIEQFRKISQEDLLDFIFQPGFSTKELVSELSGRGAGLDVVRSQLQAVKGTVTVASTPQKGTTFTLCLPLTLTIAKLVVCSAQDAVVALPAASIQEILVPETNRPKQLGEERVLSWREQLLPVYRLTDLLSYHYPVLAEQKSKAFITVSASEPELLPILVMQGEKQNFALEVEGFGKEQEWVIKPFGGKIEPPEYIYGCTVLGDGSLVPAIDVPTLVDYVQKRQQLTKTSSTNLALSHRITPQAVRVPTVMVIDDSTMMRRTLALTLQKVGCRVLQAKDGGEAIELLQQNSQLQAIISDLEMPNCNGFEFLNHIRQEEQFAQIPIIMLTSRSNDKHRQLAMQLGATAYLNKPYIEQEFLSVLKQVQVL
jgi:chemotaxis family two-component system sensor histidine kinase/response regulator PixL